MDKLQNDSEVVSLKKRPGKSHAAYGNPKRLTLSTQNVKPKRMEYGALLNAVPRPPALVKHIIKEATSIKIQEHRTKQVICREKRRAYPQNNTGQGFIWVANGPFPKGLQKKKKKLAEEPVSSHKGDSPTRNASWFFTWGEDPGS